MTYAFTSPLSVNMWVCGGNVSDINGDLCCGAALIPRSKRSPEFQATIEAIEAIFALGQQKMSRTINMIIGAAIQLNPTEESITPQLLRSAILKAKQDKLFILEDGDQYCVDVKSASGRVDLYPYLPFINAYSPLKVKYPTLFFPE